MTSMQDTPVNESSAISGALQQATHLADAGRSTEAIDVLARAIDRHGDFAELHTAQGAIEHQCSSTGKSRPFEFPTIDGHQERQRVESRDSFRRVSALEYLGNVRMHDLSPTLIRSSEASCRSLCFIKRNPI
jgi:hypothetical protein